MGWSDPAVEQLKQLWAAKKSITEIARTMGKTRSQIGGKLFRLGLTEDVRSVKSRKAKVRAAAVKAAHTQETRDRRERLRA